MELQLQSAGSVRTVQSGSDMTAYISGEIDHHTARRIREKIDMQVEQQQPKLLKMNFSAVSFMDSSGIGLVMGRYRLMQLYGGTLRVVSVPAGLKRMMELSGLGVLHIMEAS